MLDNFNYPKLSHSIYYNFVVIKVIINTLQRLRDATTTHVPAAKLRLECVRLYQGVPRISVHSEHVETNLINKLLF